MSTSICWLRHDLRIGDNPALHFAAERADRVIALYIHAPEEAGRWQPGAASRWWLHHALTALAEDLAALGGRLIVMRGDSLDCLRSVIARTGANSVLWNRRYEPICQQRDRQIEQALREDGIEVENFNAALLVEPWEIQTQQGGAYRVFTPYWRNISRQIDTQLPLPPPQRIGFAEAQIVESVAIDALQLLPRIPWDSGLTATWQPGEAGARAVLARFIDGAIVDYPQQRDRPDQVGTSRLSPYLAAGNISPRQIVSAIHDADAIAPGFAAKAEPYVRQLGWREFSYHMLHHAPHIADCNLDARFDGFPWAEVDPGRLSAWQRGNTGIPIVDAGMRELWQTGWMHNRVRMVVASFLTKNLRYHWLHGARWFWDTLVDADLANNTQGWQWTAGTGADAAPYFRVFNPVLQGERFDPLGSYVRRHVPELARVPDKFLQRPWTLDAAARIRAGIAGSVYETPIVDLAETRNAALSAYQAMRSA